MWSGSISPPRSESWRTRARPCAPSTPRSPGATIRAAPRAQEATAAQDRATYEGVSTPTAIAARTPVDPTGVLADLRRLLPPETIITGDAGNFWTWFGRYHRFGLPGAYLGPTSGAMGYAMPAALGAAFARPGVPVLAVAGDGGFLMTGQELETAVRHQLPIIALVFNNRSYGTIRMHQERTFPGRVSATALGEVDFALFARALGAHGERVDDNRDFAPALERALALRGPALIEVRSDPELIAVGRRSRSSAPRTNRPLPAGAGCRYPRAASLPMPATMDMLRAEGLVWTGGSRAGRR